jgi:hypothetical protein
MPDVYYAETITDNGLPLQDDEVSVASEASTSSNGATSMAKITDNTLPKPRIARETISSSLNTQTKKILGEYEFGQQGAIKIGNYENGVSGDLRLSPNGITARNNTGTTTFAIDGTTGDATFKGNVQAGAFFVGTTVKVEESTDGNGRIVLYNNGVAQIVIGDPS